MKENVYELIKKYMLILNDSLSFSDKPRIYVKADGDIYTIDENADIDNIKEADVIISSNEIENAVLENNKEYNSLVISNTTYLKECREDERTIVAVLDDMAQIVGEKVKVIPYDYKGIEKALKKAAGCMIRNNFTITAGRTIFEAIVALEVLEKSAEVNLKAEVIGGGHKIPKPEALLMRQIYIRKYSKGEIKWKKENEN